MEVLALAVNYEEKVKHLFLSRSPALPLLPLYLSPPLPPPAPPLSPPHPPLSPPHPPLSSSIGKEITL